MQSACCGPARVTPARLRGGARIPPAGRGTSSAWCGIFRAVRSLRREAISKGITHRSEHTSASH
jgi:hypothetical protein